jgi:hypothetical protein
MDGTKIKVKLAPFQPKAYILSGLTFWSKGYYPAGILFGAASCTAKQRK